MNKLTNYHTHSIYCDGLNTAAEMAKAAFEAGIEILGFSSHTAFPISSVWHMDTDKYDEYFYDINELKKQYEGKMEILVGVEAEHLPPVSHCTKATYKKWNIDYMIGSVHYVIKDNSVNGGCFTVDGPAEEFYNGVQTFFSGNGKKAIQAYFASQRAMIQNGDFDIVGHIDLVRKRNDVLKFFNENDSWYRKELKETAKVVAKNNKIVEVNTGGMARSNMKTPYPSPDFLKILNSYDVPITINSDSHSIDTIVAHYDIAVNTAKEAGYSTTHHLSNGRWCEIPL